MSDLLGELRSALSLVSPAATLQGATNRSTPLILQPSVPTISFSDGQPMPGQFVSDPQVAAQFASGKPRPLGPGEYVQNPDGTWSNELTETIDPGAAPSLNEGRATVVPTLWVVNGKPVRVDPSVAANYAVQSGLQFPSFDTMDAANAFAEKRERGWQAEGALPADLTKKIGSLWSQPKK